MALMRGAAVVLTLALATACGGGGSGGGLSDSAQSRRRMPSCGSYTATEKELSAEDRAVRDCFLTAFRDGTQKEVTITAPTLEGDAVVTI